MDIREWILFKEQEKNSDRINYVPVWARADHLERIVPLKEIWGYPKDPDTGNSIADFLVLWFRKWRSRRKKDKKIIRCHSYEEMDRIADQLIEKGYCVERKVSLLPYNCYGLQIRVYAVVYWEQ